MAISDLLQQDLNRLVNQTPVKPGLPGRLDAPAIPNARGSGLPTATNPSPTAGSGSGSVPAVAIAEIRKEVITVYSTLIITENGSFEKPVGWPAGPAVVGWPDPNEPYYEQKRVHLVTYERTTMVNGRPVIDLVEDRLLIPMAAPQTGYFQGIYRYSSWVPELRMVYPSLGLSTNAQNRVRELRSEGVLDA